MESYGDAPDSRFLVESLGEPTSERSKAYVGEQGTDYLSQKLISSDNVFELLNLMTILLDHWWPRPSLLLTPSGGGGGGPIPPSPPAPACPGMGGGPGGPSLGGFFGLHSP